MLGRGARPVTIENLRLVTWDSLPEPSPDESFRKSFGPRGENLEDLLICPLYSPRGEILGFEARGTRRKYISQYKLTPQGFWNPVWIGLHPQAMERIWDGALIWVVEGQFDLYALEWALSEQSVVLGSLRAHLTPEHIEFLRRMSLRGCEVRMVYDLDESGRRGTVGGVNPRTGRKVRGALEALGRVGVRCADVPYRGGSDPGEIWDSGGAVAVRNAFREEDSRWISGKPARMCTT